jgi:hypothetical protein
MKKGRWSMFKRFCKICGNEFSAKGNVAKFCDACKYRVCKHCGKNFKVNQPMSEQERFCSKKCWYASEECRSLSSKTMSATNLRDREKISERMKKNNPGSDPVIREKMTATKRINGTIDGWKNNRGGNGSGLTAPQKLLLASLGSKWKSEIAIKTAEHVPNGRKRDYCKKHSLPTNYKIDIGNTSLKLGIEIDGYSHTWEERKCQDTKKQKYLKKCGWRVLRFTNQEVMMNLSKVLLAIKREIRGI